MTKKNILLYLYLPVALFSLVNIIFRLHFENTLGLNPSRIFHNGEIWRLITFPLVDLSLTNILIMLVSLFLFLPQLDKYFAKLLLITFFCLIIVLQGALFTIMFWGMNISFTGVASILAFILTITGSLIPKEKVLFKQHKLGNNLQAILILSLLLISSKFELIFNNQNSQAQTAFFPIIFGVLVGYMFYFQIYFFKKYYIPKKRTKSLEEITQILTQARESVQKLETSLVNKSVTTQKFANYYENQRQNNLYQLSDDPEHNEDILNKILDKIIAEGKDALTQQEKKILKELSRKI